MIGQAGSVRPQPRLRPFVLLVFAVIVGVLAMHALGATGPQMPEHGMPATGTHAAAAPPIGDCPYDSHGCDGRAHHADVTCASGALDGAMALADPALAATCLTFSSEVAAPLLYGTADGGRAPPTLAELQLLRI
ncbi:DUF6153 family protein [Streptomyces sp. H39-S7]|uniref:DUF6153 family protein n=1 Tax=Streptomyces sp. H39-S7 TaxID=3004357 RepID=UPI0022AEB7EF|nr:DUF6153 family protein [Streptomyces sp. H39-S7]MCZ4121735.1 DUF6153 family protein [Streptomyces sp. H39-S7]